MTRKLRQLGRRGRMRQWRRWQVLGGLACCMLVVVVAAIRRAGAVDDVADAELVELNWPADLVAEAQMIAGTGGPPEMRQSAFVRGDFSGSGTDSDIVAAYTNGISGRVRVLQRRGTEVVVGDHAANLLLGGDGAEVSLVEIDQSPPMEIVASFGTIGGRQSTWIFHWNGTGLDSIGPTDSDAAGRVSSAVVDPAFRDLDGDGVPELLGGPTTDESLEDEVPLQTIYKWGPAGFLFWKEVLFYGEYVNMDGRLFLSQEALDLPAGNYRLTLISGDDGGSGRLKSGAVRIDGQVVAPPCSFGRDVRQVVVAATLSGSSTMEVELRGAPGGRVGLLIEDQ